MDRPQARGTGVEANAAVIEVDPAVARSVIAPLYDGKMLTTGETFLAHADGIVEIVRELRDDADLLAAAYLFGAHDVLREPEEWLRSRFGPSVAQLVNDLRILMRLSERTRPRDGSADSGQAEALRKMLLAMVNDLRVVLLRLASRLQTLRYFVAEERADVVPFARETLELFAPLANRLGIWQMKWELEDLSFRILEPQVFQRVAQWVEERREERESFIAQAMSDLRTMLVDAGIDGEVSGRPKHIYSIWRKMQRKHIAFEQLFDVRAVRIVVETVAECYAALGVVHGLWHYIPGEFDDYIATPKDNDYRSIHTAVIGPEGKSLEIQIRSRAMHDLAELGVAAHWRYKEGGARDADYERKIAWVRRLLDPAQSGEIEGDPIERLKGELFSDRIYAMTPRGDVIDLPRGATPLDFAYHVHTDLGHRCRGAKVNGRIVPLTHALAHGDVVEIITGKQNAPSRDWLSSEQGFLLSPRSRAKVRAWFRNLDESEHRAAGRATLERELARAGVGAELLAPLVRELHAHSGDELQRLIGAGEISAAALEQALARLKASAQPELAPVRRRHRAAASRSPVAIDGVGDLPVTLARCCGPVPPEPISGYLTLGRGVTVHRRQCPSLLRMRAQNPERVLQVEWNSSGESRLPVQIRVEALDRRGLLRDVSDVMALEQLSIEAVNSNTDPHDRIATIVMRTAVRDSEQLGRVLQRLGAVPNVLSAQRLT